MNTKGLNQLVENIDGYCNIMNKQYDKMDECIAAMNIESLKMSSYVDRLIEITTPIKKCIIIPFIQPTKFRTKQKDKPTLRVRLV